MQLTGKLGASWNQQIFVLLLMYLFLLAVSFRIFRLCIEQYKEAVEYSHKGNMMPVLQYAFLILFLGSRALNFITNPYNLDPNGMFSYDLSTFIFDLGFPGLAGATSVVMTRLTAAVHGLVEIPVARIYFSIVWPPAMHIMIIFIKFVEASLGTGSVLLVIFCHMYFIVWGFLQCSVYLKRGHQLISSFASEALASPFDDGQIDGNLSLSCQFHHEYRHLRPISELERKN
eukprot:977712_1